MRSCSPKQSIVSDFAAQSMSVQKLTIVVHRDPRRLDQRFSDQEAYHRAMLWWWMVHVDQQYALLMHCPPAVTSLGDCPTPDRYCGEPMAHALWSHLCAFTTNVRTVGLQARLTVTDLAAWTNQLLQLPSGMPQSFHFDDSWLKGGILVPAWPFNTMAACLHLRMHSFVVSLSRRTLCSSQSEASWGNGATLADQGWHNAVLTMTRSCREVLRALQFLRCHSLCGSIAWTLCQQAYNAAVLLGTRSDVSYLNDYDLVVGAHQALIEIGQIGGNDLARSLAHKLGQALGGSPTSSKAGREGQESSCKALTTASAGALSSSLSLAPNTLAAAKSWSTSNQPLRNSSALKPAKKLRLSNQRSASSNNMMMSKSTYGRSLSAPGKSGKEYDVPARDIQFGRHKPSGSPNQDSPPRETAAEAYASAALSGVHAASSLDASFSSASLVTPVTTSMEPPSDSFGFHDVSPTTSGWNHGDQLQTSIPLSIQLTYVDDGTQVQSGGSDGSRPSPDRTNSYPSSSYADSSPSTLQTPSISHPVSPAVTQQLAAPTYCFLAEPQQPPASTLGFDSMAGTGLVGSFVSDFCMDLNDEAHANGPKPQYFEYQQAASGAAS